MQDRYAGDVGDFMKLTLLNWLCSPVVVGEPPLSLGIVWYLTADESHNNDGKHVGYLDARTTAGTALRPIDPTVYDALADMVGSGQRSVARLETCGALRTDTVSFAERLVLADLSRVDIAGRQECRASWLSRAVQAVHRCDLVCLDPDNGIRRDDHAVAAHRNRSEKHAYMSEIAALAGDDRSVVAYHHADRSAPVAVQAQRRLDDLADGTQQPPMAAVRTSRGSARLFLVSPSERHRSRLASRLTELERGQAAAEFTVIWWRG